MPVWNATGLTLSCYPPLPDHVAQPWDAADDYLLQQARPVETLIVNDRYGALTCALPQAVIWNDSASALFSANENLKANQLPEVAGRTVAGLDAPARPVQQVLLRLPKNQEQLAYWLNQIASQCPDATILLAGMAKHIPVSLLKWLQANSAEYEQLPVQRKARLMRISGWQQPPLQLFRGYSSAGLTLESLPGVFAREKLDIGSQVLLQHLQLPTQGTVVDLGCGNGLLALTVASQNPQLKVIATDDSAAAALSARHNAGLNRLNIDVRHGDVLQAVSEKADLILCNPPFHDGHKQLTNIAQRMFEESRLRLNAHGVLYVIANRHLPYQPLLNRLFHKVSVVSSDPRFSVYRCSLS